MVHTHFVVGMHVHVHIYMYGCHFSLLPNAIDVSLTQDSTEIIDAYFWMTKDPQLEPGP